MNKMFKIVNAFALQVGEELNKEIVAIRVFNNCLVLYFTKGSCRFYSKKNIDWGNTGTCYFITNNFNRLTISKRLEEQYEFLINWTIEYINANYVERLWLAIEYNIKYK